MRRLLEPIPKPRDILGADLRHMGGKGLVKITAPIALSGALVNTLEHHAEPQMRRDRGEIIFEMLDPHELPGPFAA
jgi:hypothetical protein